MCLKTGHNHDACANNDPYAKFLVSNANEVSRTSQIYKAPVSNSAPGFETHALQFCNPLCVNDVMCICYFLLRGKC